MNQNRSHRCWWRLLVSKYLVIPWKIITFCHRHSWSCSQKCHQPGVVNRSIDLPTSKSAYFGALNVKWCSKDQFYLKSDQPFKSNTERLKYDDTHSDSEFSESELYPIIAWLRQRYAHETPTKRLLNVWKAPAERGNAYETPTQLGGSVNFKRIFGQNGCLKWMLIV